MRNEAPSTYLIASDQLGLAVVIGAIAGLMGWIGYGSVVGSALFIMATVLSAGYIYLQSWFLHRVIRGLMEEIDSVPVFDLNERGVVEMHWPGEDLEIRGVNRLMGRGYFEVHTGAGTHRFTLSESARVVNIAGRAVIVGGDESEGFDSSLEINGVDWIGDVPVHRDQRIIRYAIYLVPGLILATLYLGVFGISIVLIVLLLIMEQGRRGYRKKRNGLNELAEAWIESGYSIDGIEAVRNDEGDYTWLIESEDTEIRVKPLDNGDIDVFFDGETYVIKLDSLTSDVGDILLNIKNGDEAS